MDSSPEMAPASPPDTGASIKKTPFLFKVALIFFVPSGGWTGGAAGATLLAGKEAAKISLKQIAKDINDLTNLLAQNLKKNGFELLHESFFDTLATVSYTHLTLPTILLV